MSSAATAANESENVGNVPGTVQTFAGGFVVLAVVGDGVRFWVGGAGGSGDWMVLATASFVWAARVGLGLGAILLLMTIAAGRLRRWLAPVVFAFPAAAVFSILGLDLLDGPGISSKSYVGALRGLLIAGAPLGCWILGVVLARVLRRAPDRFDRPSIGAAAGAIAVLLYVDATVKPYHYPAAHLLIWFFIVAILGLAAARAPARRGRPLVALLVLAALVPSFTDPLGWSEGARRLAWRDTLFLKRALRYLGRSEESAPSTFDPALLAELGARPKLSPADLDRLFPKRRSMNVLFVSIDALRPDRLGRNGYARKLTPNLDRLLERATYFSEAWTMWPSTLMAFSSLFRSVPPTGTDVYREFGAAGSVAPDERQRTLAEVLQASGRRTEAVTTFFNPYWVAPFRIGFDRFNDYPRSSELRADQITDYALRAVDRDPSKPFFLWTHYWDSHDPYEPPAGYAFGSSAPDRYDGEVRYADEHLGRLLDGLQARGLVETTMIVLFADHGEEFGEHGRPTTHGSALSRLEVHVPVGIVIPGARPAVIPDPVTLGDLAPTVLEIIGLEAPPTMAGRSLLKYVVAGPAGEDRSGFPAPVAYAELDDEEVINGRQVAAQEGRWKLAFDLDSRVYSLHDVVADPGEKRELSAERPVEFAHMREVLGALRAAARRAPEGGAARAVRAPWLDRRWAEAARRTLTTFPLSGPQYAQDLARAEQQRVLRECLGWPVDDPTILAAAAKIEAAPHADVGLRRLALRVLGGGGRGDGLDAATKSRITAAATDGSPVAAAAAVAAARLGLAAPDATGKALGPKLGIGVLDLVEVQGAAASGDLGAADRLIAYLHAGGLNEAEAAETIDLLLLRADLRVLVAAPRVFETSEGASRAAAALSRRWTGLGRLSTDLQIPFIRAVQAPGSGVAREDVDAVLGLVLEPQRARVSRPLPHLPAGTDRESWKESWRAAVAAAAVDWQFAATVLEALPPDDLAAVAAEAAVTRVLDDPAAVAVALILKAYGAVAAAAEATPPAAVTIELTEGAAAAVAAPGARVAVDVPLSAAAAARRLARFEATVTYQSQAAATAPPRTLAAGIPLPPVVQMPGREFQWSATLPPLPIGSGPGTIRVTFQARAGLLR